MKYTHPTIVVDDTAPGYFVISGHAPQTIYIEGEGHLVPPDRCIISKEIPSDLLRAIADAKDGGGSNLEEMKEALPVLDGARVPSTPLQANGPSLLDRVLNVVSGGNIQVTKLAERLDVAKEEIQALDGTSEEFHIARGGWVKLGKKEGEE